MSIRRVVFVGTILLSVVLLIIWINRNKINSLTGQSVYQPTDSLYNAFDQLPKGKYEIAVAREQVTAYYSGNTELFQHITHYFEKRADKENNHKAWAYLKSNLASTLIQSNPDSAIALAKASEVFFEDSNDVGLGNVYNTIANSYYFLGNLDSAKFYMTKGYLFATTRKIDAFISSFGINLGTLYYDQMLYGAASYYFNNAFEAAKREKNVPFMLINNITSILSVQHRLAEADSLWNIYLDDMLKANDPYEQQLYFLNRVLHLQNMKRLNESRVIYTKYQPEDIFEVLRIPYIHAMLNQTLHDNQEQAFKFFKNYKHWIGKRYVPAVSELYNDLSELIEANHTLLPIDTIIKWEQQYAAELKEDPKAASHSNKLKSLIAAKQGNVRSAFEFLQKSSQNEEDFNAINDSLRSADFAEKNDLSRLRESITLANLKVEQAERDNRYVNYLWMLSFLVLIGFIVALLFALSYRKTKLDYALEQISFMKAEEQHVLKEQELNTRIVNLSQLIVLKAQDLGKKIKLVASENKEALQEVKKEIDELSRLGIEEKPQLADKLMDDHQALFNRFSEFSESGNLTEKRIFILSVDGYKPKEIANVVGVSIQYVHNVRTRLRKKLNLDNTIEWESLKKG